MVKILHIDLIREISDKTLLDLNKEVCLLEEEWIKGLPYRTEEYFIREDKPEYLICYHAIVLKELAKRGIKLTPETKLIIKFFRNRFKISKKFESSKFIPYTEIMTSRYFLKCKDGLERKTYYK